MIFATCESSMVVLLAAFHLSPGSFSVLLSLCGQPQTSGIAGALSHSSSLSRAVPKGCVHNLFFATGAHASLLPSWTPSVNQLQLPDPPSSCSRSPHPFQPRSHRAKVSFPSPTPTVASSYYTWYCVLGLRFVSISQKP